MDLDQFASFPQEDCFARKFQEAEDLRRAGHLEEAYELQSAAFKDLWANLRGEEVTDRGAALRHLHSRDRKVEQDLLSNQPNPVLSRWILPDLRNSWWFLSREMDGRPGYILQYLGAAAKHYFLSCSGGRGMRNGGQEFSRQQKVHPQTLTYPDPLSITSQPFTHSTHSRFAKSDIKFQIPNHRSLNLKPRHLRNQRPRTSSSIPRSLRANER